MGMDDAADPLEYFRDPPPVGEPQFWEISPGPAAGLERRVSWKRLLTAEDAA